MKKSAFTSGGASLIKDLISTPTRRGPTFVRTKVGKIRLGRCPKTPVAGCAGYGFVFPSMIGKTNPYCAQNRSQGSRRRICPYRLAVPEKIFALFVRSIFSTATDSPPCFIRHRRRSAPNPPTPFPEAGKGPGWAGKCRAAVWCSGYVRTCGGGGSRGLGRGTMIGRKMSR